MSRRTLQAETEAVLALTGVAPTAPEPNPCRRLYGPGPDQAKCGSCALVSWNGYAWKCRLRTITAGAGSDHRVGWKACGRYQRKEAA